MPELVGEADELRDAAGLHFPHDLAAMHLDGHLADPELAGDLLVEPPGDDQRHHLALARGQRLEAGAQFGQPHLAGAAGAVLFERRADRVEQILVAERLGQELDGAGLHRPHRHRDVAIAGDEDDRQLRLGLRQLALHVETAAPREAHVEHDAAGPVRPLALQEFLRRGDTARHRNRQI